MSILSELNPTTWAIRAISAIALAGAMWWAWSGFKGYIAAPLVIKAEAKKDDFYIPKLKAYEKDFNGLTEQINKRIADTNAATEKKLREVKNEADRKIQKYKTELATQKLVSEQIASDRAAVDVKRLLDNIKTPACNGVGQSGAGAGASPDIIRLRDDYKQCETDLGEAEGALESAVARAAKAEAGLRALKN